MSKVPLNYKIIHNTGFIIFAPGHKVSYYLCTAKQSFIIFGQTEIVNYQISTFALYHNLNEIISSVTDNFKVKKKLG